MKLNGWLKSEIDRAATTETFAHSEGRVQEDDRQQVCFYSSPIRDPEHEQRRHSDAFLEVLVEPALRDVDQKMRVIRADGLPSSPITAEVYKYVVCSDLMIADLSYHNPNVLLEVGIRFASGKPCVLISRSEDSIPSNLRDERVVLVNTSEFWRFQSEIEVRRGEIAEYSRWALSPQGENASPLKRLFPSYRDYFR